MKYISTRDNSISLDFKTISLKGVSQDGGLYLPKDWNMENFKYTKDEIIFEDLAYNIIRNFVEESLTDSDLRKIIKNSYKDFSRKEIVPLRKIDNNNWLLELFHGPTLAFKDIALQFLGNLFNYYLDQNSNKLNIIGATSGDTGSAAIEAVKGNKNINIFILHPVNRVSNFQRRQMTTVKSKNVFNIGIKGTFDDCQFIVKKLFKDKNSKNIKFGSINSINWTRIMAQITYYIYAYLKLSTVYKKKKISFSVPTGNFGDAYAGYIAKNKFNIPINKIIVATNENDILDRFFRSGTYYKNNVKETNSPSMDIQVASNFERLLYDLKKQDSNEISNLMKKFEVKSSLFIDKNKNKNIMNEFLSYSISQKKTLQTIKDVYKKYNIILDPHTAVGYASSLKYLKGKNRDKVITLATAHPAKFADEVFKAIKKKPILPTRYENIFQLEENYKVLDNNYKIIKNYILNNSV